jgi:hypothetical protein
MSLVKANTFQDASGGSNAVFSGVSSPPNSMGFRNRIINGAMVIDQRNAGASSTPATDTYTLDRWGYSASQASKFTVQQNAASVTPPAGFTYYLGATVASSVSIAASDYFWIQQFIEGYNIADLGWGSANAQAVTLSFWVRSSLTGTFGGALQNSANNRSYPFSYTISVANTWEQKTVNIAGDTTGTWLTTNGKGIRLSFGLGVGSDRTGTAGSWAAANYASATGAVSVVGTGSATFYITGVQLEAGTNASAFERIDYGRQLIQCQRYYAKSYNVDVAPGTNTGVGCLSLRQWDSTGARSAVPLLTRYPVSMRAAPTLTVYSINGNSGNISESGASDTNTTNRAISALEGQGANGFSGASLSASVAALQFYNWHYAASAEL